jgi:hypothetical protein
MLPSCHQLLEAATCQMDWDPAASGDHEITGEFRPLPAKAKKISLAQQEIGGTIRIFFAGKAFTFPHEYCSQSLNCPSLHRRAHIVPGDEFARSRR